MAVPPAPIPLNLWSRIKLSKLTSRIGSIAFEVAVSFARFAISALFVLGCYGIFYLVGLEQLKLFNLLPLNYIVHTCVLAIALRFVWTTLRFAD